MEKGDIIKLAIAFYKDKVQHEIMEKFRVESNLLLQADAEARRTVQKENILAMARLKTELDKFNYTYFKIRSQCGPMQALEDYIHSIECEIKRKSIAKNRKKLTRS